MPPIVERRGLPAIIEQARHCHFHNAGFLFLTNKYVSEPGDLSLKYGCPAVRVHGETGVPPIAERRMRTLS